MKMTNKILAIFFILSLVLSACGPNKEQQAATSAAETQAAASPTPIPSDTPTPTDVPTDTPEPTDTPIPSDTPTATATKPPTNTPTITPTPGPFSFFDDFSTDTGGWENCEGCVWTNGTLVMGPYDPSSYFHSNYCTACGDELYYRMAVDVTFIEGNVDRYFGVIFAEGSKYTYYLGISPWGFYTIDRWDFTNSHWDNLGFKQSSAVIPSYGTNHIEVQVQPTTKEGYADYYVYLNDSLVQVLYTLEVEPTWVGLGMNYHAQVAAYDNWEYVVIEP